MQRRPQPPQHRRPDRRDERHDAQQVHDEEPLHEHLADGTDAGEEARLRIERVHVQREHLLESVDDEARQKVLRPTDVAVHVVFLHEDRHLQQRRRLYVVHEDSEIADLRVVHSVRRYAFHLGRYHVHYLHVVVLEHEEQHVEDSVDGQQQGEPPVLAYAAHVVRQALAVEYRLRVSVLAAATQDSGAQPRTRVVCERVLRVHLAVVLGAGEHVDRRPVLRQAPVAGVVAHAARALRAVRTRQTGHVVVDEGAHPVHAQRRRVQTVHFVGTRPAMDVQRLHAVPQRGGVQLLDAVARRAGEVHAGDGEATVERVEGAVGDEGCRHVPAVRARRHVRQRHVTRPVQQVSDGQRADLQRAAHCAVAQPNADTGCCVQRATLPLGRVVLKQAPVDRHQPVVMYRRLGRQWHVHGATTAWGARHGVRVGLDVGAGRHGAVLLEGTPDDVDTRLL